MASAKRQRQRARLQEAAAPTVEQVRSDLVALDEAALRSDGTVDIKLIDPGWGTSGYYSADVLEAAGTDQVWPAGTQMFWDHPTEGGRPERSLRDLAAVLESDATWRPTGTAGPGLYATARVFENYRELVGEMAPYIGVSVRAGAEISIGEAEGRRGRIVERIVQGESVDFVTKAGRGGAILSVLEAAGRFGQATEAGLYTDDLRDRLRAALLDRYGDGQDRWCWVRDFNDTDVVFELGGDQATPGTFQTPYLIDDAGNAVLDAGDPTEVKVTTTYTPATPTTSQEETTMPITPEERTAIASEAATAVLSTLTEAGVIRPPADPDATTVDEAAVVELTQRAERAEGALLVEAARKHVAGNDKVKGLPEVVQTRLVEALANAAKATNDGKLDVAHLDEAMGTAVDAEVKYLQEAGLGSTIAGVGGGTGFTGGLDDATKRLEESFKGLGMNDDAAKAAAAGR